MTSDTVKDLLSSSGVHRVVVVLTTKRRPIRLPTINVSSVILDTKLTMRFDCKLNITT